MRFPLFLIACVFVLGSCSSKPEGQTIADDEMIEYRLQAGQYAVVVILNDGVTLDQAKKVARRRAAELAVSGGFRYFLIQSETEMQVMKSKVLEAFNEEIIIEGNFATAQLERPKETVYSALRVVFQCFENKPKGKCYKACNLTDCSKKGSAES